MFVITIIFTNVNICQTMSGHFWINFSQGSFCFALLFNVWLFGWCFRLATYCYCDPFKN